MIVKLTCLAETRMENVIFISSATVFPTRRKHSQKLPGRENILVRLDSTGPVSGTITVSFII